MDQVHKFLNFWIFALIPVTSIFTLVYYGQRVNTGRCSKEKQSKSTIHVCPILNQKISTHNRIILHKPGDKNSQKYNYMNKNTQTINRNCFLKSILYVAKMAYEKKNIYKPRYHKRISENTFKKPYTNNKRSFNNNRYKTDKTLSAKNWNFKAKNTNSKVTWAVKLFSAILNPRSVSFVWMRSWK